MTSICIGLAFAFGLFVGWFARPKPTTVVHADAVGNLLASEPGAAAPGDKVSFSVTSDTLDAMKKIASAAHIAKTDDMDLMIRKLLTDHAVARGWHIKWDDETAWSGNAGLTETDEADGDAAKGGIFK